jgi:hypothetical protein
LPWFAICYAAQSIAVGVFFGWGWALAYAVALPYTGAVALLFRDRLLDARRRLASFLALVSNRDRRELVQAQARSLVTDIHSLLAETQS